MTAIAEKEPVKVTVGQSKESLRKSISDLETKMKNMKTMDLEIKNHFSKDLYCREMFIPKGTLLVGKIHKYQSLNICSKGDISILTEDGFKRIQAPFTVVSKPGVKRVGYAHEDTVWLTVHATKETDIDKIEEEVIAKDFCEVVELSEEELTQLKKMQGGLWLGQ